MGEMGTPKKWTGRAALGAAEAASISQLSRRAGSRDTPRHQANSITTAERSLAFCPRSRIEHNGPFLTFFENARFHEGSMSRLASPIEAQQHIIAHVVVEADLSRANATAVSRGEVVATYAVEADTVRIRRRHPGGQFGQRAENAQDANIDIFDTGAAALLGWPRTNHFITRAGT